MSSKARYADALPAVAPPAFLFGRFQKAASCATNKAMRPVVEHALLPGDMNEPRAPDSRGSYSGALTALRGSSKDFCWNLPSIADRRRGPPRFLGGPRIGK